jgi:hypothetical protein
MYAGHNVLYHAARWVLAIVVIMMVFSLGVQVGELKNVVEGGSFGNHSGMMEGYNTRFMMLNAGGASTGATTATPSGAGRRSGLYQNVTTQGQ